MATADKLSYLLETKEKIRDSINNDISLIEEDTIFREYPNKIKSLSDTLKSYIPTDIKIGAGIQVNDAVPLNAKSLIIDGNSYQKTTKGKNLYDINDLAQLSSTEVIDDYIDITFDNSQGSKTRYLEFHSKVSSLIMPSTNYTVIAEILEVSGDGTLRLNSTSEGQNVSQFSIGTNYSFQNLSNGQLIFYPVTALDNFDNAIRGLRSNAYFTAGQMGSLKIRISIIEGEVTQDNFEYEPFTGGIASPNPNYPQEKEVIENLNLSNNDDYYSIDLQGNFLGKINDIKDTLDLSTGILTKKIGKVSFDDYDEFSINSVTDTEVQFLTPSLNGINLSANNIKSNYFSIINGVTSSQKIRFKCLRKFLNISGDSNNTEIKNAFTELMNGKNLEFYYELETPQTVQLNPVKIKMYEGTNNIELISNLESSMKIEYYKDYKLDTNNIEQKK